MKLTHRIFRIIASALALLAGAAAVRAADRPPEPQGYRMEDYRSPTPTALAGARVVDTEAAAQLWRDKAAVFIDVLPHAPKPPNLPASTVWREKRRDNIPGSLWLPDVGYGAIAPETQAYFARGLERASGPGKARPLVFYCLADCWMSWNAAKRALSMGYANVIWYPDGTDGWSAEGHELAESHPEPRE
ncbi:MAG TPA: PQQ-dependent catabolism-associated CXXCW motif protein [Rhodoblastus sp.]|nr:PQQ-dependent catabolism-associated CXXCW motif protein [Rhodoblastus sp.]